MTSPKVTGLSPMTGPPGTKIIVRGENLGNSSEDILALTINGVDCWPYLEWKSSKKIITRCVDALGSGFIIITTKSGGIGSSEVQFNCHEETVGPTDESAIWVDDISHTIPDQEILGTITGASEEFVVDITSSNFNTDLYLVYNHANCDLNELRAIYKKLQTEIAIKSDPEHVNSNSNRAALLKTNLSTIMESLQALEHLSRSVAISKDNFIDDIVISIKQSLSKTRQLFDPLLAQRDLVQSIESAMHIFRQNETLFNLPSAIETSIKTKNYDSVVADISDALSRLQTVDMDHSLTEKIQKVLYSKINDLRTSIEDQLHQMCRSDGERNIGQMKKLINHVNRLGESANYDVWIVMREMQKFLVDNLKQKFDYFLELSLDEAKKEPQYEGSCFGISDEGQRGKPPYVVQFVQSAMKLFNGTYYDLIALGQSYFDPKDEFFCKESSDIKHEKLIEFENLMVSKPIVDLCNLLRLSLVPDSSRLDKISPWPPNDTASYVAWLRHVLQSVVACHLHLTKVNPPPAARAALEDFKDFVFELRVRSMQILFVNSARFNKNLHHQEDWSINVDDLTGGTTKLPMIFEKNVMETLRFANETIFRTNFPDEKSLLKRVDVQASMKELAHSLINSFLISLDQALIDSEEHPVESNRLLLACKSSSRVPPKYLDRILITISNCQFTRSHVFVRLQDEFEKLESELKMDRFFKVCSDKYGDYINKLSEKFCRIRCADLSKCLKTGKEASLEDIQTSLMIVNSQIFLVAPQLVNTLMTSIVDSMHKDILIKNQ